MSREHPDYRLNMELINDQYPEGATLTINEVMGVTRIRTVATVRKHFRKHIVCGKVSKAVVARFLCGESI